MRFLANENFPRSSVRYLRDAGYDVAYGSEDSVGAEDREVLVRAVNEERIPCISCQNSSPGKSDRPTFYSSVLICSISANFKGI